MRYIGGKARIAKALAPLILQSNPSIVVEPFCGALNVTVELLKLNPNLKILASDLHTDLIDFWEAVKLGWEPPLQLSLEEYTELRHAPSSPLRTFAGYGCSFSGKFWGGYASDKTKRNYCLNARNSVLKTRAYLKNVEFTSGSYDSVQVPGANAVIYCDPPYANTTKPGTREDFSTSEFWHWARGQSCPVYVSEYTAPNNVCAVWSKEVKTDMHTRAGKATRVERLYKIN